MKKKVLIIISIIVIGIMALWLGGIIPKQIGKIFGTKYMKDNFPEMQIEYVNIEWNKYYGDYIITFKDKENESYGCVIGPKYFPISIGQGLNAIMENYQKKYSSNTTTPYIPDGIDIADGNNAKIPANEKEYNRDSKNVIIEVLKDTISNKGVTIRITDNNEDTYGWGVEFRVQEKVNGEWKDLEYLSNNLSWIEIAYELGEDKQLELKLDIEKYYGELPSGTYRIVKPVYDNGYIDLYSNEFEIKGAQ